MPDKNFEWEKDAASTCAQRELAALGDVAMKREDLSKVLVAAEAPNDFPDWIERFLGSGSETETFGSARDIAGIKELPEFTDEVNKLSSLPIEILLEQAAELLQRAAAEKEQLSGLRESHFKMWSDLQEFKELDKIHLKEIKGGRYDVGQAEELAELRSLEADLESTRKETELEAAFMARFFSDPAADVARYKDSAAELAAAGGLFVDLNAEGKDPNTGAKRAQWIALKTGELSALDYGQILLNRQLQIQSRQGRMDVLVAKVESQKMASDYATLAVDYQMERIGVARQLFFRRVCEAALPYGAMNYRQQIVDICQRIQQDVTMALARLIKASTGLEQIFKYPQPFDGVDFEGCLLWARKAVHWLRTNTLQESNLSLVVSLKAALKGAWATGMESARWEFDIGGDTSAVGIALESINCARLRGVVAYTAPDEGPRRIWTLKVTPPRTSRYIRLDGSVGNLADQAKTQPVYLGRVTDQGDRRDPEVAGATAFFNASPFGKWKVEVIGPSAEGYALSGPDARPPKDLYLELLVVGR